MEEPIMMNRLLDEHILAKPLQTTHFHAQHPAEKCDSTKKEEDNN